MTRPNRDLDQAGHTLQRVIALNYTEAIDHLMREVRIVDGYGARGEQVNVSGGGARWLVVADEHGEAEEVAITSVEQAAGLRMALDDMHGDLRYQRATVLLEIRKLNELVNKASKMRLPRNPISPKTKEGLCCSHQAGKAGVVEWGDALCFDYGDTKRGGLCYGHYMKWWRWRRDAGIDTSKDFEPA